MITTFVLPAHSARQCAAALLCPAQVLRSYISSASQVLVGALLRRYGLGSLAHRAGGPVASSVTMRPFLSRAFVKKSHIATFASSRGWLCQSAAKAEYRPCRVTPMKACASQHGSQSAIALGVCLGSLAHRGWHPSSTTVADLQLRQSYITPHCFQCPPVSR